MELPQPVVSLLTGWPQVGRPEQAFPFLTVDESGFPHVCLLSRAQLEPVPAGLLALVSSRRTRAHLLRPGSPAAVATLIAVTPAAAHYCKLRMTRSIDEPAALASAFDLVEHKADESPVPLAAMTYVPTAELADAEQWDRGAVQLRRLASML